MPGVEVHAQLLETILSDSYLKQPSFAFAINPCSSPASVSC